MDPREQEFHRSRIKRCLWEIKLTKESMIYWQTELATEVEQLAQDKQYNFEEFNQEIQTS